MSESVITYYDADPEKEWGRFDEPSFRLEFVTGLHLIRKYFSGSGSVLDVGSGPGRYAIELLGEGYEVTLVDVSKRCLDLARERIEQARLSARDYVCRTSDRLDPFDDAQYDAALLMGPLYHIRAAETRRRALSEVHRVLKPNGRMVATYLNCWGLMIAGVSDFPNRYSDLDFLRGMLGEHSFGPGELSGFTECYWSNPKVSLGEVEKAGFSIVSYASSNGFGAGIRPLLSNLAVEHPEADERHLELPPDDN